MLPTAILLTALSTAALTTPAPSKPEVAGGAEAVPALDVVGAVVRRGLERDVCVEHRDVDVRDERVHLAAGPAERRGPLRRIPAHGWHDGHHVAGQGSRVDEANL